MPAATSELPERRGKVKSVKGRVGSGQCAGRSLESIMLLPCIVDLAILMNSRCSQRSLATPHEYVQNRQGYVRF